jgi:replicative DNA helicase
MGHIGENLKDITNNFVSQPKGISTGFESLDESIWGFNPKTLVMIGARPSMGKSSLMADLVLATAKEVPVGVFSKEMPIQQFPPRLICNLANINYHNARKGAIKKEEQDRLLAAREELETLPIYVDYERNVVGQEDYWIKACKENDPNVESKIMDTKIKEWVEKGCKIIFADYLQILDLLNKGIKDQRLKVGKMAEILRDYAKQYNITFVLLSQLRRFDQSKGKTPIPTMSDLMESGQLEAHSDIILLLHRPQYYSEDRELDLFTNNVEDDALMILAKNRDGPAGNICCDFHSYSMSYRDKNSEREGGLF